MDYKQIIKGLIASVLAVLIASNTASGIHYESAEALIVAVLLLGIFNIFLKPLLMLFSLPFIVLTFGLGLWIINAVLFLLAGYMVEGFYVESFASALWGAFILSIINLIGSIFFVNPSKSRVNVRFNRGMRVSNSNDSKNSDKNLRQPKSFTDKEDDVIDI
jgi:putative membrane protein